MMTQYRNVALGELSPHVYAIAEQVSVPAPLGFKLTAIHHLCILCMVMPCHAMLADLVTASTLHPAVLLCSICQQEFSALPSL